MSQNKKHTLTINLEENEELMTEIDQLIFERAKNIVRSMVDTAMRQEIDRIIRDQMKHIRTSYYAEKRISEMICSEKGEKIIEEIAREEVAGKLDAMVEAKLDRIMEKAVNDHFRRVSSSELVKVILDYYRNANNTEDK